MTKQLRSVVYMFLISLFFASLVSAVKYLNEKTIASNQALKLQRIILKVLEIPVEKNTPDDQISRLFMERIKNIQVEDRILYVGYEEDAHTILGYAFPVGGPGFWGPIQGMVGVDPEVTKVLGIAFTKHSETPGLGGRITEDWFSSQFKGLPLHPIDGDKKIFYLKPAGTTGAPNELDAITGATNTSSAVEAFLNNDLDYFLKELWTAVEERE
ncbi:MAG: FMN-binding protein [Candidatus Aminicenantaceae bacterium]|jgi:Na+-transporting NADH:ubiquinone oxidoreductase subunit C